MLALLAMPLRAVQAQPDDAPSASAASAPAQQGNAEPPQNAEPSRKIIRERLMQQRQKEALLRQMSPQVKPEERLFGNVRTLVWKWGSAQGAMPLVVFSHGVGGCPTQYSFLAEDLAAKGYLVVAPYHQDTLCEKKTFIGDRKPEQPFNAPEDWTDQTYLSRRNDIKSVLVALKDSDVWSKTIEWQAVVLAGHSLGGYTALGLVGGWESWRIQGMPIKAVIAMAPYCAPYAEAETLSQLSVPVMYQAGQYDLAITPAIKESGGCFDQNPTPAIYVEFARTSHLGWSDAFSKDHAKILYFVHAFLDYHLRGKAWPAEAGTQEGVLEFKVK